MSNIICFIPARGGSKSIPKKNIKLLNGVPLISYSIRTALECGLRTIVSTDDSEIAQVAKEAGAEVMMRDPKLAQDTTPMFDVLREEVPKTGADIVVLLQPTSPFRKKLHIKLAIQYLLQNDKYDSVVAMERVPEKYNPYHFFVQTEGGHKVFFRKLIGWKERLKGWLTGRKYVLGEFPVWQRVTHRQDVLARQPDGSLYVFRSKNLKAGNFYGENVMLIESEGAPANINSLEDFLRAEEFLKNK